MPTPTDVLLARARNALTTLRVMLHPGVPTSDAVIDSQVDTIESLLEQIQEGR